MVDKDKIIQFPLQEKEEEDLGRLRAEIAILIDQRDRLIYQECKNLESLYMVKVGYMEISAFSAQVKYLREKRKFSLIQSALNRREIPNISEIEGILDDELRDYKKNLNDMYKNLDQSLDRIKRPEMTEEKTKEFKALYHKIVKAIHPDLHPNLTEAERNLFLRAVEAYKEGDFFEMKIIALAVEEKSGEGNLTSSPDEKERLEDLLKSLKREISDIKSSFPYDIREDLYNEDWVKEKVASYEKIRDTYLSSYEIYKEKNEELSKK